MTWLQRIALTIEAIVLPFAIFTLGYSYQWWGLPTFADPPTYHNRCWLESQSAYHAWVRCEPIPHQDRTPLFPLQEMK